MIGQTIRIGRAGFEAVPRTVLVMLKKIGPDVELSAARWQRDAETLHPACTVPRGRGRPTRDGNAGAQKGRGRCFDPVWQAVHEVSGRPCRFRFSGVVAKEIPFATPLRRNHEQGLRQTLRVAFGDPHPFATAPPAENHRLSARARNSVWRRR